MNPGSITRSLLRCLGGAYYLPCLRTGAHVCGKGEGCSLEAGRPPGTQALPARELGCFQDVIRVGTWPSCPKLVSRGLTLIVHRVVQLHSPVLLHVPAWGALHILPGLYRLSILRAERGQAEGCRS